MAVRQCQMMGWPATSKRGYRQAVRSWFSLADVEKLLTFGRSRDNGLNRVPLEGPPTCLLS
jgi:hypothetical protein